MVDTKIAVVGDYDPAKESHPATGESLKHAAAALGLALVTDWIPTQELAGADTDRLRDYSAVFLGPGAPYRSKNGALAAIRFAREQGWPFFGT
jgi:CTP synthase (UTP-ammonia lyase)